MRRVAAALAALALLAGCRQAPARAEKPPLLFVSSLPVLFAEDFRLEAPASPLREALQNAFTLKPIELTDARRLGQPGLLLMAQPRAQTAEALVDLDTWVRRGGRVLLLADPYLEWPTTKTLGDPSAPMIAFADTGLLGHWGLTLFRPDEGGTVGSLDAAVTGGCRLDPGREVARCVVGRGRVTVIADADFVRDEAGAGRVVDELEKLRSGADRGQSPT